MTSDFWAAIDEQLNELKSARTAQEVATILSAERNPDGHDNTAGDGFFAGSGGDGTVRASLSEAGWRIIWSDASYYYAMRAPDGSAITYVEGDIYTRDLRAEQEKSPVRTSTGKFTWTDEDNDGVGTLVLATEERVATWDCTHVPGFRTSSGETEFVLSNLRITTK